MLSQAGGIKGWGLLCKKTNRRTLNHTLLTWIAKHKTVIWSLVNANKTSRPRANHVACKVWCRLLGFLQSGWGTCRDGQTVEVSICASVCAPCYLTAPWWNIECTELYNGKGHLCEAWPGKGLLHRKNSNQGLLEKENLSWEHLVLYVGTIQKYLNKGQRVSSFLLG